MIRILASLVIIIFAISCSSEKKEKNKIKRVEPTKDIIENQTTTAQPVSEENWDEFLDSYENYITKYIKIMKKVKDDDTSIMSEYAEMMSKATDFSKKMEKAEGKLTVEQLNRFAKLQTELSEAITKMY